MRMSEILQTFHCMPSCDRMDLVCRLLQHCLPCELRFLGTLVCDCARKDHDTLGRAELNANRVNYFSGFKDTGLTHEVCEKLCCALAVVHADNHPVAETVFSLLNDKRVLNFFEETTDLKVLEDFRLLYVMAVNHPALSFNQKLHLMYSFLHRMDAIFIEKCKCNFSSSFSSSSAERSGEGELGRYVPEGGIREPGSNAFIVRCEVHSVYKRPSDRRYVYMIEVEWSDGTSYTVRRTYGDFFSFQNKLLDLFPEEAGQKHKKQRVIPFLPGKKLLSSLSNRELAEKRLPELAKYARELVSLPEHVSRSGYVMEFFKPRPVDNREEYPPLHKIITLCDLLESGKARHPSAPAVLLKSSPVHSPIPIRKSPFQRLVAFGSAPSSSPAQQQRNSHTLPHSIHTSVQQPDESSLERRFTFPSRKSAFTPIAPPSSSQNQVPTTASSLTSIASSATPTSVSASPAFSTATTTSTNTPYITTSSSLTSLPSSDSIVMVANHIGSSLPHSSTASPSCTDSSALITATCIVANPHPNAPTLVTSSSPSLVYIKSSPAPSVAPQLQTMQVTGIPTTSIVTKLPMMQMSPTTYATSPLIVSNVTQVQARTSITTPSPPHSGTSTPKGFSPSLIPFGNLGIPQQFIGSASPVAPFGSYILTGSPLHSPLPSPKTPKHIHGSYNSVARTPTEYESLAKWLKAHRLHKYSSLFENVTFEELSYLSEEQLKEKGMTQGAAKKLHLKIEELKRLNFTGFRDIPFGAGMSRKPSTCSLPAALLLERGMTPSSSFEGLSPTDSTCSLDKFSSTHSHKRNTSYVVATDVPKGQRSSAEAPVITSVDAAILKVVQSNQSGDDSMVFSESPIRTHQKGSPPASAPATPKVQNRHLESSDSLRTSVKRDSSWADQVVPNEDMGLNRPEWAQMSLNGEVKPRHGEIHQGTPTHALPGHSSPFHQLLTTHPLPTSQGMPVPVRRPIAKRHSGETYNASLIQVPGTPEGKTRENGFSENSPHIPQPLMPTGVISHRHIIHSTTNTAMAAAVATYARHHHPSSNSLPLIRANRPQQSTYTAYAVNGLIPTPPLPHRTHHLGGVVSYPGGQIRGQHNVTCFNCGKRGHLGNTCPGETMDTNNPGAFHKQLEKLAKRKSSGQSQGAVQ